MAYDIISTTTTTSQSLVNGDYIYVLSGVSLDTAYNNAIITFSGGIYVMVSGNVYGDYSGFFDDSTVGGNRIAVATGGSIMSQNSAVISYGGANTVQNSGTITGAFGAIFFSGVAGHNGIINSGVISNSGTSVAVQLEGGNNTIENNGSILGTSQNIDILVGGDFNQISNYGSIIGGSEGLYLTGSSNNILNSGNLSGSDQGIMLLGSGSSTINNSGTIRGSYAGVYSLESVSVNNSGTISGSFAVLFAGSDSTLTNTGHVLGDVYFSGGANVYDGALGDVSGWIRSGSGQNTFTGGAGAEKFSVGYGAFSVDAGGGNDLIAAYGNLTASQQIDGGAGNDVVQVSGDYSAGITFNETTMTNVEKLQLAAGYSYAFTMDEATVAAGKRLTVDASALATTTLKLDASAETDGYYTVNGGGGADVFTFNAAYFSRFDIVRGGAGAVVDTLKFSSAGVLATDALINVSGIEAIVLANGANSITLTDALVASANGVAVKVTGGSGADVIDASAVAAGRHVTFSGGRGADVLTASAGADTFVYTSAADSTGPNYDTIANINFAQDKLNLPGVNPITAIDTSVTSGALSTATFNADLAAAITVLGAHHAVEFTASSGTLAGQTFLVADLNGTAGYQANADLVIHLANPTGTLAANTFI